MKKGEAILRFIKKAGKKGRRFTEIQRFIFEKNHPHLKYDSSTTNRGYYCSCLFRNIQTKGFTIILHKE